MKQLILFCSFVLIMMSCHSNGGDGLKGYVINSKEEILTVNIF